MEDHQRRVSKISRSTINHQTMTTNRKKLMKLLGSSQLRDFTSAEEMAKAKELSELMEKNEHPQPVKRKKMEVSIEPVIN